MLELAEKIAGCSWEGFCDPEGCSRHFCISYNSFDDSSACANLGDKALEHDSHRLLLNHGEALTYICHSQSCSEKVMKWSLAFWSSCALLHIPLDFSTCFLWCLSSQTCAFFVSFSPPCHCCFSDFVSISKVYLKHTVSKHTEKKKII